MRNNNTPEIIGSHNPDAGSSYVAQIDFRRPDTVSRGKMRDIMQIHEEYARFFSKSITSLLRTPVDVELVSVDQLSYQEYSMSINNPSALYVFGMSPLRGKSSFEIPPKLASGLTDLLLGGPGKPGIPDRELTAIEQECIRHVIETGLGDLTRAWERIAPFTLRIEEYETNPQFIRLSSPEQACILVSMEIRSSVIPEASLLSICYPQEILEELLKKMYPPRSEGFGSEEKRSTISTDSIRLDTKICFEAEKLSLSRLGTIAKGTLIRMPGYERGEALLVAGNIPAIRLEHSKNGTMEFTVYNAAEKTNSSTDNKELVSYIQQLSGRFMDLLEQQNTMNREHEKRMDSAIEAMTQAVKKSISLSKTDVRNSVPGKTINHLFGLITPAQAAAFLSREQPQTIALLLCFVKPSLSGLILRELSVKMREKVRKRIPVMQPVSYEIINRIEDVLVAQIPPMFGKHVVFKRGIRN